MVICWVKDRGYCTVKSPLLSTVYHVTLVALAISLAKSIAACISIGSQYGSPGPYASQT